MNTTLLVIGLFLAFAGLLIYAVRRYARRTALDDYHQALWLANDYAGRAQRIADRALAAGRLPSPREQQAIDRYLGLRARAMNEARAISRGKERAS